MTSGRLERLVADRKTGSEPLRDRETPLGPTLLDFWAWSVSDLVSNATRGRLAEFIVAHALDIDLRGGEVGRLLAELVPEAGVEHLVRDQEAPRLGSGDE